MNSSKQNKEVVRSAQRLLQ